MKENLLKTKDILLICWSIGCWILCVVMISEKEITLAIISFILSIACLFFARNYIFIRYFEKIKDRQEKLNLINEKIQSLSTKPEKIKEELKILEIQKRNIIKEINELNDYKQSLIIETNSIRDRKTRFSIEYVDQLEGLDFEEYTYQLLKSNGYINVIKTKASGDFGIDVLAEKDGIKYAVQCKNYTSPLGSKCVQEAYSGKQYYNCHVGIVLTNSTFTSHAKELAEKNGILLWDRNKLISMIKTYKKISSLNDIEENSLSNVEQVKEEIFLDNDSCDDYDDPLYNEVVEFVIDSQKASASLLQRRFKFGYNRASRMIDLLEERGIIGPQDGSKPREVLATLEKI